jgi:hypothetical protein
MRGKALKLDWRKSREQVVLPGIVRRGYERTPVLGVALDPIGLIGSFD